MKTITEKDLETLQRYDKDTTWYTGDIDENENGRYVEWDALIKLLK